MRLAFFLLVASLIPIAVRAQQPADTSVRGDSGLEYISRPDEMEQYRTGARFSDLLVVRGERAGLRVSPAAGPLGLIGQIGFRGPQTLVDDRLPLVILDGMRLDAASGLLGGTSRLEDINPDDIESIEVLSPAQGPLGDVRRPADHCDSASCEVSLRHAVRPESAHLDRLLRYLARALCRRTAIRPRCSFDRALDARAPAMVIARASVILIVHPFLY